MNKIYTIALRIKWSNKMYNGVTEYYKVKNLGELISLMVRVDGLEKIEMLPEGTTRLMIKDLKKLDYMPGDWIVALESVYSDL